MTDLTPDDAPEKPHKRWRGFRGFAKEYLIIVVGVLTALGGEQAVQWLHTQGEVAEAREALHDEIQRNMTALVLEAREDRCMQAMLGQFEGWAQGGQKPKLNQDLLQSMRSSVWDVSRTGAVAEMPTQERLALARFYGSIDNQMGIILHTRDLMTDLRGYLNLAALTPAQADEVLKAVGRARPVFQGEADNIPVVLEQGRKLGVEPAQPAAAYSARVDDLCAAAGVTG